MPSGSMWSKDNHLDEFKEYTYENICFYLTITWYAVSFKTKFPEKSCQTNKKTGNPSLDSQP